MSQLRIPADTRCAVRGCDDEPTHVLNLRMRRCRDTGADWGPNLDAYFCTTHATEGALVTLVYEPVPTDATEIRVVVGNTVATRTRPIVRKDGEQVIPGQPSLV